MADPSAVTIIIGGHNLTRFGRVGRIRIDDLLNDAPNTAALSIVLEPKIFAESGPFAPHAFDAGGFNTAAYPEGLVTPPPVTVGAPIGIYLSTAADVLFGGTITTREQYDEFEQPQHVRLDLTCIDYTRQLNRRKVVKEYGQASASTIVVDVIANFAQGISNGGVQPGLPTVTGGITFTFEEVSRALSRIAEKIGAYWYVDYTGVLHFFVGTEAGPVPAPIVPGGRFSDLKITADLTQVRTRVIIEGDGGTAVVTLPAGDAITPLSQTTPFSTSGGMAKIGPTRVTYAGIHAGGAKTNTSGIESGGTPGGNPPAPPGAPTAAPASASQPGGLSGGPYVYAVTFELSDGSRSDLGAPSSAVTIAPASAPIATTAALELFVPAKGPIAVGVTSVYATSFVAANGQQTAITTGGTELTGRPVAAPVSFSLTGLGGGSIAAGFYDYAVTYLTPAGETTPYFVRGVQVTAPNNAIRIFLPQAQDGRVVGRRIYRSSMSAVGSPPALPWHHVVDVPNNDPGVTYDDTKADAQIATRNYPEFTTATDVGEAANVQVPTSADPRITKRRLYRKDGPGEYRLVAEIPDNATTTFRDLVVAPGGDLAPTTNAIKTGAVNLSNIAIGPAGTVRRRIFRTAAGGSQFRELVTLTNNTTTTHLDNESDSTLGGSPLPPQGTIAVMGTIPPTPVGSSTLAVNSIAGFPSSGWVLIESTTYVRYFGTTTGAGLFYLTGIPASGPGAITAAIQSGAVVTATPALVGVSPVVPVTLGDEIQLIVQVDDLAAQAALAALEGGDGIIEHYIQDRRLSEAGARARGLAELELFKKVETRLSYVTHDVNTQSGRTVHVDLPAPTNLTGDFLIQRVTIDDVSIAANWMPRRKVSASTTRFSFEDVLARILMEQA